MAPDYYSEYITQIKKFDILRMATQRVLAIADIDRARTVFEWCPAPKPGTGSKPGAPPKSSSSAKKKAAKS